MLSYKRKGLAFTNPKIGVWNDAITELEITKPNAAKKVLSRT
jgi:hypothetical protein